MVAVMGIRTNSKLEVQVFCSILGTASEVGSGNRVIERKPLAESLPWKVSLARPPALRGGAFLFSQPPDLFRSLRLRSSLCLLVRWFRYLVFFPFRAGRAGWPAPG